MQWQTCAIELRPLAEDRKPMQYKQEFIIPLLEKERLGSGGFGRVYKVKLAASHQTIYKPQNVSSALIMSSRSQDLARNGA
jgi:hypothetical protein